MSIGPGALPTFHRHDILRADGEVQITTTCVDLGTPRCIGRHYGFSPREDARIVLANRREASGGEGTKVIAETHSLRCHQERPQRNHHCVLVFTPKPTTIRHPHRLPCRPSTCRLNLVVEADHKHARDGQVIVIGADTPDGTVRQDKGRLNAITLHKHVPPPKRYRTANVRSHSIPIAPSGKAGRRVIYSERINNLRKGDVIEASARHLVTIASLPYPSFVGTDLILSRGPHSVSPTGVAKGAVSTAATSPRQTASTAPMAPARTAVRAAPRRPAPCASVTPSPRTGTRFRSISTLSAPARRSARSRSRTTRCTFSPTARWSYGAIEPRSYDPPAPRRKNETARA